MAERKKIPPPPSQDASWEEQAAYHEKYSAQEIEAAGYLLPLSAEDLEEAEAVGQLAHKRISARKRRGQFNISLDPDELAHFLDYAEKMHIPPTTLARAWLLQRLDQESQAG